VSPYQLCGIEDIVHDWGRDASDQTCTDIDIFLAPLPANDPEHKTWVVFGCPHFLKAPKKPGRKTLPGLKIMPVK